MSVSELFNQPSALVYPQQSNATIIYVLPDNVSINDASSSSVQDVTKFDHLENHDVPKSKTKRNRKS